jgi:biotin operon repressor
MVWGNAFNKYKKQLILLKGIVLLHSEINNLSKTIDSPEALLKAFVNSVSELKFTGVNIRASLISEVRAELRLEAQNQKILLPLHPQLHPSRKILNRPRDAPSLIISPHIPDDLAADYQKAAINHGDLNGRLFIQVPGLLLDRAPKRIVYRNPLSEPDLFSFKASRITRALLSNRDRSWSQEALTERTQVSRGLVSRILTTLTNRGYVTQESPGSRHAAAAYRLTQFDQLLDAWKTEDLWSKRGTVKQYSLLSNDAGEIARTIRDALGEKHVAFTQWFAAHVRHPYTTPPIVSTYVPKGRRLPELQFAREVASGGNLWLIVPADKGVFLETQDFAGFRLVSDVQIYLDLLQVGQRGPDAAEALRAWDGFAR